MTINSASPAKFQRMERILQIPVAVKVAPETYFLTQQLSIPTREHWNLSCGQKKYVLEYSALNDDNWAPLGEVIIGKAFKVLLESDSVPIFRTTVRDSRLYIGVRRIDLEGPTNFRDIGGYTSHRNSQVRFGRIFRSDNLSKMTRTDWNSFSNLGIKTIVDLRRNDEKLLSPTVLPRNSDVEIIDIPIDGAVLGRTEILSHILAGEVQKITDEDMAQMYDDILTNSRYELTKAVRLLMDATSRPAIIHCTAGKDRTGLAIALIHAVLGVPNEALVSDFLLSNSFRTPARIASLSEQLKLHRVSVEDIAPYLSASPPALKRALQIVTDAFGGATNYLETDDRSFESEQNRRLASLIY